MVVHAKIQGKLFNFIKAFLEDKILKKISAESFQQKRGVGVNYFVFFQAEEWHSLKTSLTGAETACQEKLKNKKMDMDERQAIHYILRKIKELRKCAQNQEGPLNVCAK